MDQIQVYTIGFTKKNARTFFELLQRSNVRTLIDVRLNNVSQLAGFTKKDDLKYFLEKLVGTSYLHVQLMAPTKDILDGYKKNELSWDSYTERYNSLLRKRKVETMVDKAILQNACFMCSEPTAEHCHRRLVVEYLASHFAGMKITHL